MLFSIFLPYFLISRFLFLLLLTLPASFAFTVCFSHPLLNLFFIPFLLLIGSSLTTLYSFPLSDVLYHLMFRSFICSSHPFASIRCALPLSFCCLAHFAFIVYLSLSFLLLLQFVFFASFFPFLIFLLATSMLFLVFSLSLIAPLLCGFSSFLYFSCHISCFLISCFVLFLFPLLPLRVSYFAYSFYFSPLSTTFFFLLSPVFSLYILFLCLLSLLLLPLLFLLPNYCHCNLHRFYYIY